MAKTYAEARIMQAEPSLITAHGEKWRLINFLNRIENDFYAKDFGSYFEFLIEDKTYQAFITIKKTVRYRVKGSSEVKVAPSVKQFIIEIRKAKYGEHYLDFFAFIELMKQKLNNNKTFTSPTLREVFPTIYK